MKRSLKLMLLCILTVITFAVGAIILTGGVATAERVYNYIAK
jgi:butyrate kinase